MSTPLAVRDYTWQGDGVDEADRTIEWRVDGCVPYSEALAAMEARANAIVAGDAPELVRLLEHPPLYTAGTSADPAELLDPRFPVHVAGRGGRYTYHGPGQRVGYVLLDLNRRGRDVRHYVHSLEGWMIAVLRDLDVSAQRVPGRVGIWVDTAAGEAKIGAIGVRIRRWVTLHGFSINRAPNLEHFSGIVPCGISGYGVTSLAALGRTVTQDELDRLLLHRFPQFIDELRAKSLERPSNKR